MSVKGEKRHLIECRKLVKTYDTVISAGDRAVGAAEVPLDGEGRLAVPGLVRVPELALWRAPTDNDRLGGTAARWADQHRGVGHGTGHQADRA